MKLVPFTWEYVEASVEWHQNPVIASSIGLWNKEYTLDDLAHIAMDWKHEDTIFGIEKDRKPVGYVMLSHVDKINMCAESHITVGDTTYWGTSLPVHAYRELLKYAFNNIGLRRVYTFCTDDCKNILGILDRGIFGFINDGYQREALNKNGKYIGMHMFGLLKNDFISGGVSCQRQQ